MQGYFMLLLGKNIVCPSKYSPKKTYSCRSWESGKGVIKVKCSETPTCLWISVLGRTLGWQECCLNKEIVSVLITVKITIDFGFLHCRKLNLLRLLHLLGQFLPNPSLYTHEDWMPASLKLYGSCFPVIVNSCILAKLPYFWRTFFSVHDFKESKQAPCNI